MTSSESQGGCPDVDLYARMLAGRLAAAERVALERHIDACPDCMELVAELGKIYGRPASIPPGSFPPSVQGSPPEAPKGRDATASLDSRPSPPDPTVASGDPLVAWIAAMLLLLLAGVTVVAWTAAPAAVGVLATDGTIRSSRTWLAAVVVYAAVMGPVGILAGLPVAIVAWRDPPWATVIIRVLLWTTLPTLVLLPFAVFSLRSLSRVARAPSVTRGARVEA
ncbi:MAG: zf-HC2 domain-containing protein [Polyangiaceae bacterium]|nr:zf-HC2 domain-containing protein [Polyangiaceae bacterium]